MSTHLAVGELAPGHRLVERYEIIRELGRGGYSIVYAASDRSVGREVAIKVLVPPPVAAKEARERLKREVQTFRNIRHPNVVGVHDFLEDGPVAFVVMDLVDGADLATLLQRRERLGTETVATIGREIAEALAEAHRAGVLHRDIKPANILVDREGRARLTDFGAARLDSNTTLTRTGGLVGTVAYLAPEVWLGQRPDARADVYALGLTLFEALTGRLPERPSAHLPPPPSEPGFHPSALRPGLPPWLDQAIARATAADPRHRFATASQLAEALASKRAPAVTIASGPEPPAENPRLPISIHVLIGGVVAAGAMAAIAASPHFYWATPVVALLLIRAARRDLVSRSTDPAAEARPASWDLTEAQRTALAGISAGPARALLDDILVLAQLQLDHAATAGLRRQWHERLDPVVTTALEAAHDLGQVDDILGRLDRAEARPRHLPKDWWDNLAGLERTRDGLAMALLDLLGTLSKARGAALGDVESASARLRGQVGEIGAHLGHQIAAVRVLEQALR
ncbi:MAG: protein kinase domain-containing protein [Gemmatimonadales bacterium]